MAEKPEGRAVMADHVEDSSDEFRYLKEELARKPSAWAMLGIFAAAMSIPLGIITAWFPRELDRTTAIVEEIQDRQRVEIENLTIRLITLERELLRISNDSKEATGLSKTVSASIAAVESRVNFKIQDIAKKQQEITEILSDNNLRP